MDQATNSSRRAAIHLGNGTNSANLGCNTMSNSDASCNGHDLGAPVGRAAGVNDGCGLDRKSNVEPLEDPYAALADNIPSDPCSSYSVLSSSKKGGALPASNKWAGPMTLSGTTNICGDLQLTANTFVTAPSDGAVLILWNGRLLLDGYTLKTTASSGLTIIFAGSNSGSYAHYPSGTGILDVAAPTSGTWSGVALYQAPNLTTNVDITYTGNDPAWDITGLVYMPNAAVTFKGAVNKSSNGYACFALVADSVLVSGTGSIFTGNTECERAGLIRPTDDEGDVRLLN